MRAPTASELLNVWEDGLSGTPARRALLLLTAMHPGAAWDALAGLSIGQRDAELLRLRDTLWGPRMAATAACPACRERLDLTLDIREMLSRSNPMEAGEISLTFGEFRMVFHIPTSQDLMAAEGEDNVEAARLLILDRCLLSAQKAGDAVSSLQLPAEVIAGVAESMAQADPLADIQLNIDCPACRHKWRAAFDIVSFLWTEIEAWAGRILSEVHTLARAYGWREAEILALSAARRQFYLEMVGT